MNEPRRKDIRLTGWDYASNSVYHVTICTRNRVQILGTVVDPKDYRVAPFVDLSTIGRCCDTTLQEIQNDKHKVQLLNYVIMPNHVHLLVWVRTDVENPVSLQSFVRFFKSKVTKAARQGGFQGDIWQKSFYDVIVRNAEMLNTVWEYIDANPAKWNEDEYCSIK